MSQKPRREFFSETGKMRNCRKALDLELGGFFQECNMNKNQFAGEESRK